MPSKSPKQKRFMAAAAHDKAFAKRAGIPPSVAREFNRADTRAKGGCVGEHDGSSAAMARGGSAFSYASTTVRRADG